MPKLRSYYKATNNDFTLLQGNCIELIQQFEFKFDMIFADPPYFLSNGGISVNNGKKVCVDKGEWDLLFNALVGPSQAVEFRFSPLPCNGNIYREDIFLVLMALSTRTVAASWSSFLYISTFQRCVERPR